MRRAALLLVAAIGSGVGCAGADEVEPLIHPSTSSHSTAPPTTDPDPDPDPSSTDTYVDTGSGSSTGLHGVVPAVALPLPTFTEVIAMDSTARTSANLVGQPSVVWFYPAAFTGG